MTQAYTQNVWENNNSEVHPFLYRMAQKGFIEYNDIIKPINRVHVLNALNTLKKGNSILSNLEKKELNFYLQEYKRPNKFLYLKKTKIKGGELVPLFQMILNYTLTHY